MAKQDVVIGPTGGLARAPKIPEMTHGGFRSNRHHEAIEELADERDMGRNVLRQTEGAYPESLMQEGNSEMMKAWGAGGVKENLKVSKWAKK